MDERDRMERRAPWMPWAVTSVILTMVAGGAYMLGQQHQVIATAGEPVRHMHWGFFPGGIFFWVFLFMVFGLFRRMWWCGRGYGSFCRPWRAHRYYGYHPYDDERDFEEWHRREHERMDGRGGVASPSGTRPGSSSGASSGGDTPMT